MRFLFSFFTVALLMQGYVAQAQQLQGRVVDSKTAKGLPYVNIGVLHRGIGTVADIDGNYTLNLTGILATDTVKYSCIGYAEQIITVDKLQLAKGAITLSPKAVSIGEVIIKPKKIKKLEVGIKTDNNNITGGFMSNDLGSELATVFTYTKGKPAQLKKVYFSLVESTYDTLLFRLNVYDFKKGVFGDNLLLKPVYIRTTKNNGIIEVDLSSLDILFNGSIAVSIEWMKDLGPGNLFFSCRFFKGQSFARKTSHADWEKIPVGMGIWGDVEYESK